jgi:hypothetical protein
MFAVQVVVVAAGVEARAHMVDTVVAILDTAGVTMAGAGVTAVDGMGAGAAS